MKTLLFLLTAFTLSGVYAQQEGRLSFESTSFDFGEMAYGSEKGIATFKFTNVGDTAVKIDRVSTTRHCKVEKQPVEVKPGSTSEISIRYDTTCVGPIRKTVTVYSNAVNPTVTLKLIGRVLPKP